MWSLPTIRPENRRRSECATVWTDTLPCYRSEAFAEDLPLAADAPLAGGEAGLLTRVVAPPVLGLTLALVFGLFGLYGRR